MASDNDHAPMNQMALAPKHKVFLSHSGAQKDFVEQLNVDLKQCDCHAFFDIDRECLPIGENFPHLIMNAIEQCEVGVVVLSNEFLSTKWPMVELVKMVEMKASKGDRMFIMPIFFGVTIEDLKVEENRRNWKAKWEKFAENDIRIDILEWEQALKMLNPTNGLVYNSKNGQVKFREEIVRAICFKVSPYLPWDDSHVQGKSHFIEIIDSKKTLAQATQRVGLYGVGGIGKTTTCKFLCNHFENKFYGKVCHVEVGKGTEMENLHMILKKFTSAQRKHLKELSIDECRTCLKNIKEKVFLAVDNVSSDSEVIKEVRRYLGAGYKHGSVLIVTARSLDQLKEVMDANDCSPMPEINEDEAKNLFLRHAEIKGGVEDEILDKCINRCKFDKGKGDGSSHYLPLVLEVLGTYMRGSDPSTWVKKLQNDSNVLNRLREKKHPVFSTLRISFDALEAQDKDLFLDVAIFHSTPLETETGLMYYDYFLGSPLHWNVYEWLRLLHDLPNIEEVKYRLNTLKAKSLLEEVDDYEVIGMHDLWKEFALNEIEAEEMKSRRWVLEDDIVKMTPETLPMKLDFEESILIYGGWDNLERISISGVENIEKVLSISSCPSLKALRLMGVEGGTVDFIGLSKLRIMEIYFSHIKISSEMQHLKNLRVLIWTNIKMESRHILKQIGSLTYLQILWLEFDNKFDEEFDEECDEELDEEFDEELDEESDEELDEDSVEELDKESHEHSALSLHPPTTMVSLDLSHLRSLQVASICGARFTMLSLSSKLRVLDLSECVELVNCPSLENMSELEVLSLYLCPKLETLPNLQKLKKLKYLDISSNEKLTQISGLEDMVALQQLRASDCSRLQGLSDMSKLTTLQKLYVDGCGMLECIPGMSNLIALQELYVTSKSLRNTSNSGKLMNLVEVTITGQKDMQVDQESEKIDWMDILDEPVTIQGHTSSQFNQEGYKTHCSISKEDDLSEMDISSDAGASQAVDGPINEDDGFTHENNVNGSTQKDDGFNQGDDYGSNKKSIECCFADSPQALDLEIIEHVLGTLMLRKVDCELKNLHKMTTLESLELHDCGFKRLPDMGNQMRLKSLAIFGCNNLRSWNGVGGLELMEPSTDVKLQCKWTLSHLVRLHMFCSPIQFPDLCHFPQLIELSLWNSSSWNGSTISRFAFYCQDDHVKLKRLSISNCTIIMLPDLSKFSSMKTLVVEDCQHLTSLTTSKPLTTLESLMLSRCKNLKVLPAISHMKDLKNFTLFNCGVTLNRHECEELSPSCKFMDY